jgi:hypothetical protein
MTQTLDAHRGITQLDRSHAIGAPISTTGARASRFGIFAITFAVAFAVLYTLLEQMNWPMFTYHPAVNKVDFWRHAARSGEGPPMYWYGWLVNASIGAPVVAAVATFTPIKWIQRTLIFGSLFATVLFVVYLIASYIYRGSGGGELQFDASGTLTYSAGPNLLTPSAMIALLAAAVGSYLVPSRWTEKLWPGWAYVVPIPALAILGYSLLPYFTR